ncbi:MAG: hypothetical protein PVF65_12585 [Sphingomonadales bacterium]
MRKEELTEGALTEEVDLGDHTLNYKGSPFGLAAPVFSDEAIISFSHESQSLLLFENYLIDKPNRKVFKSLGFFPFVPELGGGCRAIFLRSGEEEEDQLSVASKDIIWELPQRDECLEMVLLAINMGYIHPANLSTIWLFLDHTSGPVRTKWNHDAVDLRLSRSLISRLQQFILKDGDDARLRDNLYRALQWQSYENESLWKSAGSPNPFEEVFFAARSQAKENPGRVQLAPAPLNLVYIGDDVSEEELPLVL